MIVAFLKTMILFSLTVQLEIRVLIVLANWSREKVFVMDNASLRQIVEGIPELKYRYNGSFPADCIPRLPTFSFAIINTSPSNEAGKHWIMIARLNRTYYYADSVARPSTKNKFLNKKYQKLIQQPVQQTDKLFCSLHNFCSISTIYIFSNKFEHCSWCSCFKLCKWLYVN